MATAGECTVVKDAILAALTAMVDTRANLGMIPVGKAPMDEYAALITAIDGVDTLLVE